MTEMQSNDYAAYAEDAKAPAGGENILAQITRVARELRDAKEDVEHAQEALKRAQDRVRLIEEGTLPQLMDEAGQKRLTTVDGYELERGEVVRASVPPGNIGAAAMWLRANGGGALVKRDVILKFGMGEDQKAAEAVGVLEAADFHPDDKVTVHPQSLSAFVREKIGDGAEVPMSLLGVYVQSTVKMKPAKLR